MVGEEYLGRKIWYAPTVKEIREGIIVNVRAVYSMQGTYIYFDLDVGMNNLQTPRESYPDNSVYFSLEEAIESVKENLEFRRKQARESYESDLRLIDRYEDELTVISYIEKEKNE